MVYIRIYILCTRIYIYLINVYMCAYIICYICVLYVCINVCVCIYIYAPTNHPGFSADPKKKKG